MQNHKQSTEHLESFKVGVFHDWKQPEEQYNCLQPGISDLLSYTSAKL